MSNDRCIKCGSFDIHRRWSPGDGHCKFQRTRTDFGTIGVAPCNKDMGEHIEAHCRGCGYEWNDPVVVGGQEDDVQTHYVGDGCPGGHRDNRYHAIKAASEVVRKRVWPSDSIRYSRQIAAHAEAERIVTETIGAYNRWVRFDIDYGPTRARLVAALAAAITVDEATDGGAMVEPNFQPAFAYLRETLSALGVSTQ